VGWKNPSSPRRTVSTLSHTESMPSSSRTVIVPVTVSGDRTEF